MSEDDDAGADAPNGDTGAAGANDSGGDDGATGANDPGGDTGAAGANDPGADDGAVDDVHDRAAAVRDHLEATETLPVDPAANRWIGEAHAVAADAADPGAPESVVYRRMGEVVSLLGEVESAGHPDADERVAAARELARALADDDGDGERAE